jgi:RNA polymerase sigma-70 factor (ECF subfamily)
MRPSRRGGNDIDDVVVAEIYREHGDALRRFVRRASGDPNGAEDVVQETVLKVWQAAPDIAGSMRGYLFRTARNVMIDNYRRAASRPRAASSDLDIESMPETVERIDALLTRVLMEEALRRISKEHREVVLALHYNRLSVAEAAATIGIPVGTVKSRAFYALRALRAVLEEMGVEA